ncbi:MAG: hypothetical protein ACODAD_11400, partial [Planctomycetota bacterium]
PEHLDNRIRRWNEQALETLESALEDFRELRAGVDGHLRIRPVALDLNRHRLFAPSHVWESVTPYQLNRHARLSTAEEALKNDLFAECERRALPRPEISVLEWNVQRQLGLRGTLRLRFKDAVEGPVILGRTRHIGGGVFSGIDWKVA